MNPPPGPRQAGWKRSADPPAASPTNTDGNLTRHPRPDGSFIDHAWNARNLPASIISDAPLPWPATPTAIGGFTLGGNAIERGKRSTVVLPIPQEDAVKNLS